MCPYVDPNPVDSIDGNGHNYFRSKNPYKLKSTALFGEAYWDIRDDLKLMSGFSYTETRKTLTQIGRTSCRDRVCTYLKFLVSVLTCQNKHKTEYMISQQ